MRRKGCDLIDTPRSDLFNSLVTQTHPLCSTTASPGTRHKLVEALIVVIVELDQVGSLSMSKEASALSSMSDIRYPEGNPIPG